MTVRSKLSNRKTSNSQPVPEPPADGGRMIVLTAPLTEAIDHAGYFIQMAMASLPIWMEGVINRKYPKWREVEHNPDGSITFTTEYSSAPYLAAWICGLNGAVRVAGPPDLARHIEDAVTMIADNHTGELPTIPAEMPLISLTTSMLSRSLM